MCGIERSRIGRRSEYTTPLGLDSWFTATQDGASLVLGFVMKPLRGLESWFATQDGASLVLGFVMKPLRGNPEIKSTSRTQRVRGVNIILIVRWLRKLLNRPW